MAVLGIDSPHEIYAPQGCQFCNGSGYKGRFAVHEIMYVNDKLRNLINKHVSVEEVRSVAEETGMVSLTNACKNAVLRGETSLQEFMSLSVED